jgi:hypothetical protein
MLCNRHYSELSSKEQAEFTPYLGTGPVDCWKQQLDSEGWSQSADDNT